MNEGKNEFLNARSPMYISGVPGEVGEHALNHWHLRNSTSFNGCVKELYINGKLVDFLQAAMTRNKVGGTLKCFRFILVTFIFFWQVSPGCSAMQEEEDNEDEPNPCDREPCKHGKCKPTNGGGHPGFKCKCQNGYVGELCDIRGKEYFHV